MYYQAVPADPVELDIDVSEIVESLMECGSLVDCFVQSRVSQWLEAGRAVVPADDFLRVLDAAIRQKIENAARAQLEERGMSSSREWESA